MSSAISPQFDIGNSTFSVGDRLFSLLKAATVDDVQPLAVVAAEALGSCLEVDPHLLGQAIDVLGESASYRLENVKLTMGFSSGGIARQIRGSVAATRTFVLMAMLKAHMDVKGIAELLFEMLVYSGLCKNVATSKGQIRGLCAALESYANKLTEVQEREGQVWSLVLPALAGVSKRAFWSSLIPEEGAKIIFEAFHALREDDVDRVVVRGSNSGNWLAIVFCQLLPGRVDILDEDEKMIFPGSTGQGATVALVLDQECKEWTIEKMYKVRHISDVLLVQLDTSSAWYESGQPRGWPTYISHPSVYGVFLCRNCNMSTGMLDAVEVISLTILLIVLNSEFGQRFNTCNFRDICRPEFEMNLPHFFGGLGWPRKQKNLELAKTSSLLKGELAQHKAGLHNDPTRIALAADLVGAIADSLPEDILRDFKDTDKASILGMVLIVTQYILIHAVADVPAGAAPIQLNSVSNNLPDLLDLVFRIQTSNRDTGNLLPSDFLKYSWGLIAPDSMLADRAAKDVLAVSSRGYVAYLKCLKEVPRMPSDAFSIIVQAGQLKWRDEPYKHMYDRTHRAVTSKNEFQHGFVDLVGRERFNLSWSASKATSFQIHPLEETGSLNWYCKRTRCGTLKPLYQAAIDKFLLAHRVKPTDNNIELEKGSTLTRVALSNSPEHPDKEQRLVITYSCDPVADFLRFSIPDSKHTIFIQGQCSIQQCVVEAERIRPGGPWLIMASP